jgi:hypothetical protein
MCGAQVSIGEVTVSCTYDGNNEDHEHRGVFSAPGFLVDIFWGTP